MLERTLNHLDGLCQVSGGHRWKDKHPEALCTCCANRVRHIPRSGTIGQSSRVRGSRLDTVRHKKGESAAPILATLRLQKSCYSLSCSQLGSVFPSCRWAQIVDLGGHTGSAAKAATQAVKVFWPRKPRASGAKNGTRNHTRGRHMAQKAAGQLLG